jgi:poly-gamma-glutamate synthesis protein (capsule biosynthesis protein)
MKYYLQRNHHQPVKRRQVVYALVGVLVVLSGAIGFALWRNTAPPTPIASQKTVAAPQTDIQSRIMVVGDVFWARSVQTKAQKSGRGYEYVTQGLSATDRTAYDAWIANFECPITTRDIPYQQQVDYLRFNCRPEYLPELAKWFSAVTLANNHMDNNGGQQGLNETRQNLEHSGIQYTGTYDMNQTDDICEVVGLPARINNAKDQVVIPVALCGYMYVVDVTPSDEQLAVMQSYAKVMPVIAMPHMGIEYRATAEPAKQAAYRRMIDNGADVVIGAHPHVIQNSEVYKGRLIAYSVGNFLFDQQSLGRETSLGLGVIIDLTISGGQAARQYQSVGSNCVAYKDSCLQKLQAVIAQRPTIKVNYDFTCFDEAHGVPEVGSAAVCQTAKNTASVEKLGTLSKQW